MLMWGGLTGEAPGARVQVLVGGVGQLYQGDLDAGRVIVGRLAGEDLGRGVAVEELHYGAVAVAQRLEELPLHALVLVGAEPRGRAPATVERRRVRPSHRSVEQLQAAVGDAVTGYVGIDLIVEVAEALAALPRRTVAVEIEPALVDPSVSLSPEVFGGLEQVLAVVRSEVREALADVP